MASSKTTPASTSTPAKEPTPAPTAPEWTPADEQRLIELKTLRARALAAKREPVDVLSRAFVESVRRTLSSDYVTDWLIANAHAITKALAPFDLGPVSAKKKD